MRLRELYYRIKPIVPRSLQIALRRYIARRKLESVGHVWPIDPEAGKAPQAWTGWPNRKRFALVLSHDVDTVKGHNQCLNLMELEEELGFRSTFNFVPERYRLSSNVLETLTSRGFDAGVHGLVHDDKLFTCRRTFERRAPRINQYLKEWGAAGFHSPAMFHNLAWAGELNIEYDCSTFDTDPFEPQPDGVQTIFPFLVRKDSSRRASLPLKLRRKSDFCSDAPNNQLWKGEDRRHHPAASSQNPTNTTDSIDSSNPMNPRNSTDSSNSRDSSNSIDPINSRPFYVELPYTLPQDHCLFIILKERDVRIWKEKLDWIAEKGGMALLNSHPDYMNFSGSAPGHEEYPVRLYMEFLRYVKDKYAGEYWHALPREVAEFWRENMSHHCTGPQCDELKFDDSYQT